MGKAIACLVLGLVACETTEYAFKPAEVAYPIWGGPREGRVVVTFVGMEEQVAHLRLQIQNDTHGDWTLHLDPPAAITGSSALIKGGTTGSVDATMPLPTPDATALSVSWRLTGTDTTIAQSTTFHRVRQTPLYSEAYAYPYPVPEPWYVPSYPYYYVPAPGSSSGPGPETLPPKKK